MTIEAQAQAIWNSITDEMMLAKRSGMTARELAIFTDKRAVEVFTAALRAQWEEAAKAVEDEWELPGPCWLANKIRQRAQEGRDV